MTISVEFATASEVGKEIESLAEAYKDKVQEELEKLSDRELIKIAERHDARWSGGFSVHNVLDTIVRTEAIRLLSNRI